MRGTDVLPPHILTCAPDGVGHYKALEWSETDQKYIENPNLGILVEVDVSFLCPGVLRDQAL